MWDHLELTRVHLETAEFLVCVYVDSGPCRKVPCPRGERCRWRPDRQYYCLPPSISTPGLTSPVTESSSTDSCLSRIDCIVPAVVGTLGGVLVIFVVVVVVVCLVSRCHNDKTSLAMVYSRSNGANPVEMQEIEAQQVSGLSSSGCP